MVDSPSGGAPTKAPRWDLADTEGCGGGNSFSWCSWIFSGYGGIYRRRRSVRGATRGPRGWGRAHPLGAPPASWAPRSSTDMLLPPIYTYVPPNDQIRIQNPNSTFVTFCIHEIHLGACSGAPPEGASITEGFYINTIASPMMCE